MKIHQVAAQLYTLRDSLKDPRMIADTLKKVRKIGFQAVQIAGMGPIEDRELARMLRDEGLACCGFHEAGEVLFSTPEKVVERLGILDCKTATYPWPGGVRFDTPTELGTFIASLRKAGQALRAAGLNFCYHNHHIEFRRMNGRTLLETIYSSIEPSYLQAELDTYWVQFGGGDPVDWCRRMKGRLVNLHMKDYGINKDNTVVFEEIGNGNLDWKAIVNEAENAGCRWFIIEQDTCPGNPIDSVARSFQFVTGHFVS